MVQQTMKIATLWLMGLVIPASLLAQDPINNSAGSPPGLGQYEKVGGTQSNLLVTDPMSHNLNNPNNNNLQNNLIGGMNNTLEDGMNKTDAKRNLIFGLKNKIKATSNSVALGRNNSISSGSINSLAFGEGNTITTSVTSTALGNDVKVNGDDAHGNGRLIDITHDETIVLGYGNPTNSMNLQSFDNETISLGLKARNVFNILLNDNKEPVTGIGTTTPGTDKLRIVGNGTGTNAALNVKNSNNVNRFNVRNDGYTGFNVGVTGSCPGNPRAPYHFRPTETTPFFDQMCNPTSGGKANIVQEYSNFPSFKNVGPNFDGQSAKWLALGERPPASSTGDQVAYGLANVWQNNAANFVLLDQDPGTSGQTAEKDLAITFQDVWDQSSGSALTNPSDAGNRIRFLFRNSRDIDASQPSVFELMSLEPTGEVGIGDYTSSTQQANLEVKAETQGNGDPVFQVRNNGGPGSRGDLVMTANDDGNVGIGTSSPSEKLVVDGNVLPGVGPVTNQPYWDLGNNSNADEFWDVVHYQNLNQISDGRFKTRIDSLNYGLDDIMKLKPYSYYFKDRPDKRKQLGLVAQEVDKVIDEIAFKGEGKDAVWSMRYIQLIPVLINGIQEQQKQVQKQQQKIRKLQANLKKEKAEKAALEEKVNQLNKKVNQLAEQVNGVSESFNKADDKSMNQKTATLSNEDADQAMLLQNRPNPYSNETVIPYYLPGNAQNANILITNSQGQMLKRIPLEGTGKGELTLQTADLNKGQYQYTLIIDGRQIQTRKMIVK